MSSGGSLTAVGLTVLGGGLTVADGAHFDGALWDVRLYARALNAEEATVCSLSNRWVRNYR